MNKIQYVSSNSTIQNNSVKNTLELFEGGATIPFIARYRKEATFNLDEEQIALIQSLSNTFDEIEKRKAFIFHNTIV